MLRFVLRVLGPLATLLGGLGALMTVIGMLDPVSVQLSNDADPFGEPPTLVASLGHLALWSAILAFGLWLLLRPRGKRHDTDRAAP
ncbi:hypothetical protein [Lysobacter silvisoli]|uniref:Uncharacterized protein n=1 Tax=Lysobacter silvisoli TaxID=2293254 RepID=A0A371K5E4_9GAMM|nr:hypothetical protein [Lysobacter silvisoli]RDZ29161.1 hypothetical protein DX914_08735 [Lysobacter silvisoli]